MALKEGLHHVDVRVVGFSAVYGSLGGRAVLTLELPLTGTGTAYVGHPPVLSSQGRADALAEPSFDPLLGPNARPSPLPAAAVGVPRPSDREDPPPPQPESHAPFNVTGQWNYMLEDDLTTAPQRWATVQVWDEDSADPDDLLWTGMTGESGNFTSSDLPRIDPDGPGNQDVYVRFVACNAAVCVQATNGTTYSWRTETITVADEETIDLGARTSAENQFAQRPFHYINNGWDYAENRGGIGSVLAQVRVFMPGPCTFYTLADDTIHLCANGIDDKSPDDVNHEYGHYVQDKMYGDSFWPSPGGAHIACGDGQHRGLSWTEGFADFFGPRANQAVVDPQDHFYTRPWDGSLFSLDLESAQICPSTVTGDDNEFRVAAALWDLADDVDDGPWDIGVRHAPDVLLRAITGCDQSTYREFYDGGRCNWIDRGNPRFDLLATAFQNTIDYNLEPVARVTSPSAFSWVRGSLIATANATDPDGNVTSVEFRVSASAVCASFELPGVMDASAPFSATLDITLLNDGPTYWVCARAADELEAGAWGASSQSFGLDTIPPASTASVEGILGVEGWYVPPVTVELQAADNISGVALISFRLDGGEVRAYADPFEVQGDGIHTLAFFAMDVAGNVENIQPLLVLIDTGPPQIQILQPTPGAYIGQSEMTLTWSVTDTGAGVEGCAVRLDGGPLIPVLGDLTFTFTGVADGAHLASVSCGDRVDRVAEVEVSFTVDTNPLSPTGPLGPTLVLSIAGIVMLLVALLLRRRR